jgi:hypothetical protein
MGPYYRNLNVKLSAVSQICINGSEQMRNSNSRALIQEIHEVKAFPRKGRWSLVDIRNEEKVVRFVERFQASVASDGFEEFFRANTGDYAQATLNALLVMNAINAAILLRRAMWVFDGGTPPLEQNARREALSQIDEPKRAVLRRLDGSFRHCNDELASSLARYSRSLDERCCVV